MTLFWRVLFFYFDSFSAFVFGFVWGVFFAMYFCVFLKVYGLAVIRVSCHGTWREPSSDPVFRRIAS